MLPTIPPRKQNDNLQNRGVTFANYISDKGLAVRVHKEFLQLNYKKINTQLKMSKIFEKIFLHRGYTNGQETHEKMFNLISHQGSVNQNPSETPPLIHWDGYNQKVRE